jgi:hypothetical protein
LFSNPNIDASDDCNGFAFVTGNSLGTGPGSDDVDDGCSRLISPSMDLSNGVDPHISFKYWFYNGGGNNTTPNDSLFFRLRQNNVDFTVGRVSSAQPMSQWVDYSFRVKDFLSELDGIQFIVEACDFPAGHLVEAGIDMFKVDYFGFVGLPSTNASELKASIVPNPSNETARLVSNNGINNIVITDLCGRIVFQASQTETSQEIQLPSNLISGLYIVEYKGTAGHGATRWLKN